MDDHIELLTVLKELHNISGFRISIHAIFRTKFDKQAKVYALTFQIAYCDLIL